MKFKKNKLEYYKYSTIVISKISFKYFTIECIPKTMQKKEIKKLEMKK